MNLELNDVHVLLTGASGGIGLATAQIFLKVGARVTAHYNTKFAPLEPLVKEFGSQRIRTLQADLTCEDDVVTLFSAAVAAPFGPVQVIIINHGYYKAHDTPIADMSLEQWEGTFNTNLTSSFLVAREYMRELKKADAAQKEKAAIVLIGSTAGKIGEDGHADYAATKSAMMYGLCLSLKNEIVQIAPKGRVNAVAPGNSSVSCMAQLCLTNWTRLGENTYGRAIPSGPRYCISSASDCRALGRTPLRKVATPEDVANQIVILSSSAVSGHVSGQVLVVAGGMEGRLLNRREDLGL